MFNPPEAAAPTLHSPPAPSDAAASCELPVSSASPTYTREQQFEALFEGALDAVLIADNQRRYVDANPAGCALLGLSLSEIRQRRIDDFSAPNLQPFMEQVWQTFMEQGQQQGEMSLHLPDGSTRDVEYNAKAHFVPGYHLSILRDITQRKAAEAMLQASEEQFRSLVEAIPQQVWTAHPNGDLDYVNHRVIAYSGRSFEAIIGQGWQDILHPDDVPECLTRWRAALSTGEAYEVEFRLKRASDGSYRWHLGRALPLRDAQGQIIQWFGTNTDITERKQIEEERVRHLALEQAARAQAETANRAKDEFLALLSHELRTPLSAILGWTTLLRQGRLEPVQVNQGLEAIDRSAQAQARIIEDMLDVSRIILGRLQVDMEPIELASPVQAAIEVVRPTATARDIQLEVQMCGQEQLVLGDAHRLQQVVWNLLSNAIKFTPSGGQVKVYLLQVGSDMELRVCDNGQGISSEFLPYVFERLRQEGGSERNTRRESKPHFNSGLGLGLSLVRYLVEMHGGTVRAESPGPGQGATFTMVLPIYAPIEREKPLR